MFLTFLKLAAFIGVNYGHDQKEQKRTKKDPTGSRVISPSWRIWHLALL